MIEIKQLLYFRTCVEEGSISTAAEKLYTTQPNVSRVISSLETQMGTTLLHRNARGVVPTSEGKQVYKYAKTILMNVEYLDMMGKKSAHHYFSIASMPSRYLAMIFSKYYNNHADEQADYRFWEGDVNEVLSQVENHRSEIGFVYIQESQLTSFQYLLKRKRMEYVELKRGEAAIYVGKNSPYYGESEISLDMFPDMNFLKTNEGIYGVDTELEELIHNCKQKFYTNATLSTNSDYVTHTMLQNTDFAQISFILKEWDELNDQKDILWAIPVPQIGNITFGYVKRLGEDIRDEVVEFLGYI